MYSSRTLSTNLIILQTAFLNGVKKMDAQIITETKVLYLNLIVTDISLIGTKHVAHYLKTSNRDI